MHRHQPVQARVVVVEVPVGKQWWAGRLGLTSYSSCAGLKLDLAPAMHVPRALITKTLLSSPGAGAHGRKEGRDHGPCQPLPLRHPADLPVLQLRACRQGKVGWLWAR